MDRRLVPLSCLAVGLLGGCAASHASRYPSATINPPAASPLALETARIIEQHNLNAEKVQNLEATPAVSMTSRVLSGALSGNLFFERDKNFRFQVSSTLKRQADIGSNQEEFWFWANDNTRTIYKCRYENEQQVEALADTRERPLFQPEWIIEALGLREYPEAETKQIRVSRGTAPGVSVWTHSRVTSRGEATKKITLVSDTTGKILEHQFFNPGENRPVAIAQATQYQTVTPVDGGTVEIPLKIHLVILSDPQNKAQLDLQLSRPKINASISDDMRTARFAPDVADICKGAKIHYIDDDAVAKVNGDKPAGTVQRRQSLPAPAAGKTSNAPAELGSPEPFTFADEAYLKRKDPMPRSEEDLPLDEGVAGVVGVPLPTPPTNRGDAPVASSKPYWAQQR